MTNHHQNILFLIFLSPIPYIDEYEWESVDDSPQEYQKKVAASGIKSQNDVKDRILKMEVEQAKRKRKTKQVSNGRQIDINLIS